MEVRRMPHVRPKGGTWEQVPHFHPADPRPEDHTSQGAAPGGDSSSSSAYRLVTSRLTRPPGWAGQDWHCPAHDDETPSLGVITGADGRVLLNCQAGCSVPEILTALD